MVTPNTHLFIKFDHHLISFRQECCVTQMATPRTETQEKSWNMDLLWDLYPKVLCSLNLHKIKGKAVATNTIS